MLVVAHRGGNPEDVENSASAFLHGISVGADLLECDLQLAADGQIVVYHDVKFYGAPLSSFTTDELRGLIPTLLTMDEMLEVVHGADPRVRLVLDLKTRDVDRAVVPYLEDPDLRSRVLVTSTFSFALWRLKRRFPDLRTGLSRGSMMSRVPERLRPAVGALLGPPMLLMALIVMRLMGIGTMVIQHHLLDDASLRYFQRRGIRVYAWTVDDPERAAELRDLGVDYLTTNLPAMMAEYFSTQDGGSMP
ncbi:MAG TPA: glycerophosphodiester phosphodiesterase [Thermomicrobiales bacterium]|nr:glycerophosphodiester phosphodiesterase [Thermomicrobiales bacterium]